MKADQPENSSHQLPVMNFPPCCSAPLLTVRLAIAILAVTLSHPAASIARGDDTTPVVPAPEVDVDLSHVQDNDYLTFEENDAYYGLLNRAANTPLEQQRQQASELLKRRAEAIHVPIFKDMLDHPELYRGNAVTLRGHVLNVVSYDAAENPYGIEQVYEAALFTDDSQGHPTTIVFLDRPEGLPLGDKLVDGVEVTGYFYKIYYYPSADKATRRAPLILARTMQVRPAVSHAPLVPGWVANLGIILLVMGLAGLVWWVQLRDQRLSRQRQQHEVPAQLPEWNAAQPPELPLPDESSPGQ